MFLCGIDEAGRGALAGPVYAAAVILPDTFDVSVLNDSKKLSPQKREKARTAIFEHALFWHIAWASQEQIDSLNILQATLLAMKEAFDQVFMQYTAHTLHDELKVIIDGNQSPALHGNFELCVEPHADGQYPCVMAASILAKTERDRCMMEYHKLYPQYRYDLHKGYGTVLHRALLDQYGPSPIQRHSFKLKNRIGKR